MKLTAEQLDELQEYLEGTCLSLTEGCAALGIDVDDETDILAQLGESGYIECCESCSWWWDLDEFDADLFCPDCREKEEE